MAFDAAQYMRIRRNKRQKTLRELLGGKCKKCGLIENLNFDHINPKDKTFEISGRALDKPWKLLLFEVKKCQLLCRACHIVKNKTDNGEAKHGGLTMYGYHRCRCVPCRVYWNKKTQEYKQKSKHSSLA